MRALHSCKEEIRNGGTAASQQLMMNPAPAINSYFCKVQLHASLAPEWTMSPRLLHPPVSWSQICKGHFSAQLSNCSNRWSIYISLNNRLIPLLALSIGITHTYCMTTPTSISICPPGSQSIRSFKERSRGNKPIGVRSLPPWKMCWLVQWGGLKDGIVLNDTGTPWGGRQTVGGRDGSR